MPRQAKRNGTGNEKQLYASSAEFHERLQRIAFGAYCLGAVNENYQNYGISTQCINKGKFLD